MTCNLYQTKSLTFVLVASFACLLCFAGCGGYSPTIVPSVTGVVMIDGKPYPNVVVKFYPQDDRLDASFIASATTDESGAFSLMMSGDKSGCPALLCKVIIGDPPVPNDIRMELENGSGDPADYNRFKKSLKLRPIPTRYTRLMSTPLTAEVSKENHEFEFELTR